MTVRAEAQVGVIGGSGLYEIDWLEGPREVELGTPYGDPSDHFILGEVGGVSVAFLPRHGRHHSILPSELPYRANIHALKQLGVERLISVSAVGSLREEVEPRHLVVPDQLLDQTNGRVNTFFGEGLVVHVAFADPYCPELTAKLVDAAEKTDAVVHSGGTYVCIEGPQFSTRAQSKLNQASGALVVGMTALPEARLAREAELCYATLALSTDYDAWKGEEEPVTMDMVIANMRHNVETAKQVLHGLLPTLGPEAQCTCGSSLGNAIVTSFERVPLDTTERLAPIIGKYMATEQSES